MSEEPEKNGEKVKDISTLPELVWESIQDRQNTTAFFYRENEVWQEISYLQFGNMLVRMTSFLQEKGVKAGDKVALMSSNRYEWAVIDLSVQSLGAILVPLYPNLISPQVEFILSHAEVKFAFFENSEQFEKHHNVLDMDKLCVFSIEKINDDIEHCRWLKLAKSDLDSRIWYLEMITELDPDTCISISYTSGTTGEAKGVMLSHRNIVSNIQAATRALEIRPSDRFLSFLPLSHMFERTAGYYVPLVQKAQIAYAEDLTRVIENAREIHPTIITTVPRLLEKIYDSLQAAFSEAGKIKARLLSAARKNAMNYFQYTQGKGRYNRILDKLFEALVYKKLRARLSPDLRMFISGGAPLSGSIADFLISLKLPVIEGYGLTETSPVLTLNHLEASKSGSAGLPLDNIELKIADDGEILARGDSVMQGYFKAEKATADAIDADGYFHTGDVGFIDSDGFLFITDRKKDLIVTSGGKNIAPQPIERAICLSPFIEQAMIIGDRRKFISALIVPAWENLPDKFPGSSDPHKSSENPELQELISDEIEKAMKAFSQYEKVKAFAILTEALSVEKGELTATLKLKRPVIHKKYEQIINKMY